MPVSKNTHGFQNDTKKYDDIRDILRFLYMYGTASKEELMEKQLVKSASSFYNLIHRIKNYLEHEYLQKHDEAEAGSGKKYRLMYDPFVCPTNYLADTYRNCSYKLDDFIIYFYLMQALSNSDLDDNFYGEEPAYRHMMEFLDASQPHKVDEIIEVLQIIYEYQQEILADQNDIQSNEESCYTIFTKAKVHARLRELADIGILRETAKDTYCLATDIFSTLDDDSLKELLLLTQYFYNCSFLTIPGYYLSSTIDEYLQAEIVYVTDQPTLKQENDIFLYKHHRLQNVIDDDVAWTILEAIHSTQAVEFTYAHKDGSKAECHVLPIRLIWEQQYGRQYVFCYDYSEQIFKLMRLPAIAEITIDHKLKPAQRFAFLNEKITKSTDIHAIYRDIYQRHFEHVWNVATSATASDVVIHFHFTEESYAKELHRLQSTRRGGQLVELGNGNIDYRVRVQSERELVPWIRSFGASATVDAVTNPALARKLQNDFKEALMQYEAIQ